MIWPVWRQDDYGNRFLVVSFVSKALVETKIADLTQNHHK